MQECKCLHNSKSAKTLQELINSHQFVNLKLQTNPIKMGRERKQCSHYYMLNPKTHILQIGTSVAERQRRNHHQLVLQKI